MTVPAAPGLRGVRRLRRPAHRAGLGAATGHLRLGAALLATTTRTAGNQGIPKYMDGLRENSMVYKWTWG